VNGPSKVYRVGPTFWHDHVGRFEPEGHAVVVKEGRFCVYVELDSEGYDSLLGDAEFYRDGNAWGLDSEYGYLVKAAGRLHAALVAAGPPEDTSPEPSLAPPSPSGAQEGRTDRRGTSRLGWCLPGAENHDRCRHTVQTTHDGQPIVLTCSCDCHG
jgi:hypothetical protein